MKISNKNSLRVLSYWGSLLGFLFLIILCFYPVAWIWKFGLLAALVFVVVGIAKLKAFEFEYTGRLIKLQQLHPFAFAKGSHFMLEVPIEKFQDFKVEENWILRKIILIWTTEQNTSFQTIIPLFAWNWKQISQLLNVLYRIKKQ